MNRWLEQRLKNLHELAERDYKANEAFFRQLKKKKPKNLDDQFHTLHDETFDNDACLDCGNCCKSISPGIYEKDVERLARFLKKKPSKVIDEYLHQEKNGDYAFVQTPCPFLAADNYCMVYEARPKACREYPHTDRRRMYQILDITLKNTYICPFVYEIVKKLRERL